MTTRRAQLWAGAAGVVAVGLVLAVLTPLPRPLPDPAGDAALAASVAEAIDSPGSHHRIGAALVDGGETTFAGYRTDENDEFEIGSVSKAFTGLLFADAVERGEVAPDTTLGEIFGERAGTGAGAAITLDALASHRSGLPRQSTQSALVGTLRSLLRLDPYTDSADDLLAELASFDPSSDEEPEPEYSNLGFALLGMALSEASGRSYEELVAERITEPLGMDDTYVPVTPESLRDTAVRGHTAQGLPTNAWTFGPQAPAGGIRSTPADMAALMQALVDGEAPGQDATTARHVYDPDDGGLIGWAWMVDGAAEGTDGERAAPETPVLTWHNGMTGGYASFVGLTDEGRAMVVLADTALPVDGAADILTEPMDAAASSDPNGAPGSTGASDPTEEDPS